MCGAVAGRRAERDIREVSGEPITGDGFWKLTSRILEGGEGAWVTNIGRLEFGPRFGSCGKWRRISEGEEVSDFVWMRVGDVRNDAVIGVIVVGAEPSRILGGGGLER